MDFPVRMVTTTPAATQELAASFAQELTGGDVIALVGDLGAGKTTFTQGLAAGLNITRPVVSPTFVLMRTYPIPHRQWLLYHLDLYRVDAEDELRALDLTELISDTKAITVAEWPEKVDQAFLPQATYTVTIDQLDDEKRSILIERRV